MSARSLREEYPLHWLVWHNDYKVLDRELCSNKFDKEQLDPRGRTPLMLSVTLGHMESTRVLLQHGCNVNMENNGGWTVVHEAVATGDPELVQLIIERRDYQRYTTRVAGIPELLCKLQDAPDFYVEMKWEFTSWVPLVSRMCPSDTYKVYKSGANVRIDTTLLGFDQTNWQRGNRSYVFKGQTYIPPIPKYCNRSYVYKLHRKGTDETALMMEIDHDTKQVYMEQMRMITTNNEDISFMRPSDEVVSARLTTPVVTTYIDTDKISFERNKSGIWGWRSDKLETVNGYECKVYSASNVELVTKTRTEHLTEADKAKNRSPRSPLQSFLGIAESEERINAASSTNGEVMMSQGNPCNITPEEYFNPKVDLQGRDIGRPKDMTIKVQKFKATLWLSDEYPLSLQEQIMPIVDLMAISSSHFAKLKDFITLQLPAGFPVKIEIPLFHVLNARITFGNIFSLDEPVAGITCIREDEQLSCVVDESCFEPPSGYLRLGNEMRRQFSIDEDDEILQFAIQQSLMETGSEEDQVTIWEALRNQRPSRPSTPNLHAEEERLLQRAIQESLVLNNPTPAIPSPDPPQSVDSPVVTGHEMALLDDQLRLALELSAREQQEAEQRQREEEEMLERVLQLSLTEK